jgi:hypothetical protein
MHHRFPKIVAPALLAALALLLTTPSFAQTLSFPKKAVNFLTGGSTPSSIAVGDFNRDGKLDVAIANTASLNVTLVLGNGNGTFAPATTVQTFSTSPIFLVAADFNGDGKLDLAVANRFDGNVYILLGNGSGGFTLQAPISALDAASVSHSIVVGDFNGDGNLDLVVTNGSGVNGAGKSLSILLGDGLGGFTTSSMPIPGPAQSIAAADFDRDGKLDLVIADFETVYVLQGHGDGTFQVPTKTVGNVNGIGDLQENQSPSFVAVGDFNRDGIPDLAIALANDNVGIRLGTGDLSETNNTTTYSGFLIDSGDNGVPKRRFGFAGVPQNILVADFNGDGKADVAVNFATSPAVAFRLGGGDGSLGDGASFATQRGSFSAAVGDFDGDGRPDIVSVNTAGTTFSLLLNATTFTFAGDLGPKTDFSVTADQVNFPATDPRSIAAGDFNNDGKIDLAVANFGTNNVSVFLGGDAGTFTLTTQSPFDSGSGAAAVAAADFNRDGVLDLAVANSGAGTVSIFIGAGDGSFSAAPTPTLTVGNGPMAIAAGDFNGDGILDLAVANHNDNNVSVFLGIGDGTFNSPNTFAVGSGPHGIIAVDMNGDGNLDLVTANETGGNVSVLLGNGNGTFQAHSDFTAHTGPVGIAAGDFNRDGKLDLAVANSGSGDVSILLGIGNGTFNAAVNFPIAGIAPTPSGIAVGDFNRDARLDLAVTNSGDDNVSILLGDGTGSFDGSLFTSPFATVDNPVALVAGDFDRDGRLDVAVANQDSDNVSVLLNTAPPPTVIAPAAGAVLHISSVATIRWLFSGNPVPISVNVLLSRDSGTTFKAILKKTPNDGSQNWTVTGPMTAGNTAVIRVCTTAKAPVCVTGDAFAISP